MTEDDPERPDQESGRDTDQDLGRVLDPDFDGRLRRALGETRATDGVPDDVRSRLDETLAGLVRDRRESESATSPEPQSGPEPTRPDHSRPDHSRPDHSRPDHSRPDHSRPDHSRPDHSRPDHSRPEPTRLEPRRRTRMLLIAGGAAAALAVAFAAPLLEQSPSPTASSQVASSASESASDDPGAGPTEAGQADAGQADAGQAGDAPPATGQPNSSQSNSRQAIVDITPGSLAATARSLLRAQATDESQTGSSSTPGGPGSENRLAAGDCAATPDRDAELNRLVRYDGRVALLSVVDDRASVRSCADGSLLDSTDLN